jgi:hypothetical protein
MGEKGCSHVQRMRTKDSARQGWLSVATSFACGHAPWRVCRVRARMAGGLTQLDPLFLGHSLVGKDKLLLSLLITHQATKLRSNVIM